MVFGTILAAAACAYTNCAGRVIVAEPTAVTNGWVCFGPRRLSLAVFPPSEQARLRAAVGQQPLSPREVRRRDLLEASDRRVEALSRDGVITPEAARAARARNAAVRTTSKREP